MNRAGNLLCILFGICLCGVVSAATGTVFPLYQWKFNANGLGSTQCNPPSGGPSCQPVTAATPILPNLPTFPPTITPIPQYQVFGRDGTALAITPNDGGYAVYVDQQNSNAYGFAWMGFVWLNALPGATPQTIVWHEGIDPTSGRYVAGFSIAINSSGQILLSVGHNGSWRHSLASTSAIGRASWHHVALVWDTTAYFLMVDGVNQGSVADTAPPDQSPNVPVTFGSFYNGGSPRYVLNGAIDEMKFVKFSVGLFSATSASPFPTSAGSSYNFVLAEKFLAFRLQLITDMLSSGVISPTDVQSFASPTTRSTSILRAWINATYRADFQQDSLLDSGPPANVTWEDYVYPTNGNTAVGSSLYLNSKAVVSNGVLVRAPAVHNYCGGNALLLWAAYQAFGYPSRRQDWTNGPNPSNGNGVQYPNVPQTYSSSHSTVDVYVVDAGKFVLQDPTFNLLGKDASGKYYSIDDLYAFHLNPPAVFPFGNGGYSFCYFGFGGAPGCMYYGQAGGPAAPSPPTSTAYFSYFEAWQDIAYPWHNPHSSAGGPTG